MTARTVTVDRSLGVEGLLKSLKLDRAFRGIAALAWNSPIKKGSGSYDVAVKFIPLKREMTNAEVEKMVAGMKGYRLALPEEMMTHCAKHPDLQREAPIFCLGAFWVDPSGNRHTLVLYGGAGEREASLYWDYPGRSWSWRCRVAVVREQHLDA